MHRDLSPSIRIARGSSGVALRSTVLRSTVLFSTLLLLGISAAPASAATLGVPTSTPPVDATTAVEVEGTLVVYSGLALPSAVDTANLLPAAAEAAMLPDAVRLRTTDGQSVLIDGALTEGAVSGSTFVGTLAIMPEDLPDVAEAVHAELPDVQPRSDAPVESGSDLAQEILTAAEGLSATLTVVAGTITPPAVDALIPARAHVVDVAVVTTAGQLVLGDPGVAALVQSMSDFWSSQSAGQVASIAKPLAVKRLVTASACDPYSSWDTAAAAFGDPQGDSYLSASGSRHLMVIAPDSCTAVSGLGSVGTLTSGGVLWGTYDTYSGLEIMAHEFGHNLGLDHSNAHACPDMRVEGTQGADGSFSNGCADVEYYDPYDVMGASFSSASYSNAHLTALNVTHKSRLEALSTTELPTVKSAVANGPSTLAFTLNPASATSGLRGLRVIDPRSGEAYFVEYRSGTGMDAGSIYASNADSSIAVGVRVLRLRSDTSSAVLTVPSARGPEYRHLALASGEAMTMPSGGLTIRVTALGSTATVSIGFESWQPVVDRLWGDDRYTTAVSISKAGFPGTAPVVYIATGVNYPDALGAAPAATKEGAPLLLVSPTSLPGAVRDEIRRLNPGKVVVVGGPVAISDAVFGQIKALVPNSIRLSGADRFDTARKVVAHAFPGTVGAAYIATGWNYPDALSASAAAGTAGIPVVLVDGGAGSIDTATKQMLNAKGATRLTVVGGAQAISDGIARSLSSVGAVTRIAGTDRFDTSQQLNHAAFTSASHAYLATGYQFPDALAGAALAGAKGAPLYVVQSGCIPAAMRADLVSFATPAVTLLGGPMALTDGVAALRAC